MIRHMGLMHYPSEETYRRLGAQLGMDLGKKIDKNNRRIFTDPGNPVRQITMYTISYEKMGQIWFLPINLDFNALFKAPPDTLVPADDIDYASFRELLLDTYRRGIGDDFVDGFPDIFEKTLCAYVEFTAHMETRDAGELMARLSRGRFEREQLDISCFDTYKLKNAIPWFTVNTLGRTTVRLCAKCNGTALKRLLKATNRGVGVPVPTVLGKETAVDVLSKQVVKHAGSAGPPEELSRSAIRQSI